MNAKYLAAGTIAAGLTIFFWGSIAHTALPIPEPVGPFKNPQPVLDAVRAQTNGNGVYMDPRGVFVALRVQPDLADMSKAMGPYLLTECLSNLAEAFLLALLLMRAKPMSVLGYGAFGLLIGLVAWTATSVSLWNWYGFSPALAAFDLIDVPVGCGLAGLLLGWMIRKWGVA